MISIYYLTLAANLNDADAQYLLGEIYTLPCYGVVDKDKAIHYLTLAANQNHSEAQCRLGASYIHSNDIDKGIHYIKQAAYQYNQNAQYILGLIYNQGIIVQKDIAKSIYYLTLSSQQNNSNAQCLLGLKYLIGHSNQYDIEKSIYFLSQASNQSNSIAQFLLGFIYYSNNYGKRDFTKAIHYFKEASCLENCWAKNNLGVMYKNGEGVKANIYRSIEYFKEAIKIENDDYSYFNLIRIYSFGLGVEKDLDKANQLIEQFTSSHSTNLLFKIIFIFMHLLGNDSVPKYFKIYSLKYFFERVKTLKMSDEYKEFFLFLECNLGNGSIYFELIEKFIRNYDLVYPYSENEVIKDFYNYLHYGSFEVPLIEQATTKSKEKDIQNINEYFYIGFLVC